MIYKRPKDGEKFDINTVENNIISIFDIKKAEFG